MQQHNERALNTLEEGQQSTNPKAPPRSRLEYSVPDHVGSFKRAVSATNDASKISSSMIIRYDHAVVSRVSRSETQGSGLESDEHLNRSA